MNKIENVVHKSWSSNLIALRENRFHEDSVDFWLPKLTLKTENAQFLPLATTFVYKILKFPLSMLILLQKSHLFGYPNKKVKNPTDHKI